MSKQKTNILNWQPEIGEKCFGIVRRYYRTYWGGRDVEIIKFGNNNEDAFHQQRIQLCHKDLVEAFDKLRPAQGDLIQIKRLPNTGRKYRYKVRILLRNSIADHSYTRRTKKLQDNKEPS